MFVGEVLIIGVVLLLNRRTADTPKEEGARLDLVGTALSALGLGLIVYGVLRAGSWGFVQPKPDAPTWLGLSPVIWLILGGGAVLLLFLEWEKHRRDSGQAALLDPAILRVRLLRSGLGAFFFQYLLQAGLFFAVPLFLSIALGLSAIDTGLRIMPLSITLVIAAVGIPKLFPKASPRRVTRFGFLMLFLGLVVFIAALDEGAGAEITLWPMLLAGLGIGALASQLGAVTVSALPDEQSGEVGGLQNTFSNLGISLGTALSGAILMSALTASFFSGIASNPAVPNDLTSKAQTELTSGVPFISDADLEQALDDAGVPPATATAVVDENADSRIAALRVTLSVLAVLALLALFLSRSIPTTPVGSESAEPAPPGSRARGPRRAGGRSVGHGREAVERAAGVVPLLEQLHEVLAERVAAHERHGGPPDGEVHRRELAGPHEVTTGRVVVAPSPGLGGDAEVQPGPDLVVGQVGDRGRAPRRRRSTSCRRAPTPAAPRGAGRRTRR